MTTICKGKTVKGTNCTRKAKSNGFCFQHTAKSTSATQIAKLSSATQIAKLSSATQIAHPSYKTMIINAVESKKQDENPRKGASRDYIKKYLAANYGIEEKQYHYLNKALQTLVKNEVLIVNSHHRGHYKFPPKK